MGLKCLVVYIHRVVVEEVLEEKEVVLEEEEVQEEVEVWVAGPSLVWWFYRKRR